MRLLLALLPLTMAACAVAFTAGASSPKPPDSFADEDDAPPRQLQKNEEATLGTAPVVGVSIVVGGEPFDAGPLPKPPFPVATIPR